MKRQPALHPGIILSEMLKEHSITQSELARHLRVTVGKINEICKGRRGLSPEMAMKLAKAFGTTAELWFNLQRNWDMSRVEAAEFENIGRIRRSA